MTPSYQELRKLILLNRNKTPPETSMCLNLLWFNLLTCDSLTWEQQWKNNLSGNCQVILIRYFNSIGYLIDKKL